MTELLCLVRRRLLVGFLGLQSLVQQINIALVDVRWKGSGIGHLNLTNDHHGEEHLLAQLGHIFQRCVLEVAELFFSLGVEGTGLSEGGEKNCWVHEETVST